MIVRTAAVFGLVAVLWLAPAFGQRPNTPVRPVAKTPFNPKPLEISDADWKTLAEALQSEDWTRAADLAGRDLVLLTAENDKKQLAQLRYLRLFALAGKILGSYAAGNAAEAEKTWLELDRLTVSFIGKDFLLPPRSYAADCSGKLNYLCKVRNSPDALRVTATNRAGTGIHSFDYILFDAPVGELNSFDAKIFIGGVLEKAEYNDDPSKPWVIRLFFKKGQIVDTQP